MKITGKSIVMAGALLAAVAAFAAEGERKAGPEGERRGPPPGREGMHRRGDMQGPGYWVCRFLMQGENLDKLGLEGDARKQLSEKLGKLDGEMKELQGKIRELGMQQGKMMREVMEKPGEDIGPVLEKIKEIGNMRTQQSVLSMQVLATARDCLTKEQRDMLREFVMKEGHQRMEARREFNGNMERRKPQFEGRRRGGPGRHQGDKPGDKPAEKPAEKPADCKEK